MTLKFIHGNYLKYNKGTGFISCHVDALHAEPPAADLFTDKVVENLVKKTGCAGIVSTVSRTVADLNRNLNETNHEGIHEYRRTIQEIVKYLKIADSNNRLLTPYLHLSFHGMKDTHYGPYAIEVGTLYGQSCSKEVKDWFQQALTKKSEDSFPKIHVIFDNKFVGNESIAFHRQGDNSGYLGYSHNFNTFQIELSRTLRSKHRTTITNIFSEIIDDFQQTFVAT